MLWLLVILLPAFASSCSSEPEPAGPWPEITRENKPWSRWWWLGSEVDRANISDLMKRYADAGIGGLEITPLYGVQGHEDRYIDFLSPRWMDMLEISIAEAENRGMGMDMNLGTGWPFGGPQISPEHAASRLILRTWTIEGGESLNEIIQPERPRDRGEGVTLDALMAFGEDGTILDLTDRVLEDGTLVWVADPGEWELYAAFCGKTRQTVKRAAPGGEGYTLDHFSRDALEAYLQRFDSAFSERQKVRSYFNDSYEVYNASWTPGLFESFLKRRGYDLKDYLYVFHGAGDPEQQARIKADYRQTLGELLLENFTMSWTEWSHRQGVMTRNQAHGSPGNLIDLYAAVDIPECEIFGHRNFDIPGMRINDDDTRNVEPNPMMLKLATSAAHVTNKPLISNETFTWLGEHFKVALSQCKPEVEEAFLAGINHVFYHGTTYSPREADWPGWLFYASVHFGPTNSFWPHLSGLNRYIARCQSILQSGTSDNDVLVYWPVHDLWDEPGGLEMQLSVHNIQEWLVYPGVDRMADRGFTYDFVSDRLLEGIGTDDGILYAADGEVSYKALVIPACRKIPLATLDKILQLASAGALVVFESLPEQVPGFHRYGEREETLRSTLGALSFGDAGQGIMKCDMDPGTVLVSSDLGKALEYAGVDRERITDLGLKFTRREADDGKYYYLVNHNAEPIDAMVPLNSPATSVWIMDPLDGSYGCARMETGGVRSRARVQLQPGESVFLKVCPDQAPGEPYWAYEKERLDPLELEGTWKLSFLRGGPVLPEPRETDGPTPWTELDDPQLLDFSGTASYTLTFQMPELPRGNYLLDLGRVHESARVRLNGKDLGISWSLPHQLDTHGALVEGENTLVVEVANLMANRIRSMDRAGIPWRNFNEINFVNIAYEPFDASDWDTEPSGLAGPVRLIPVITE